MVELTSPALPWVRPASALALLVARGGRLRSSSTLPRGLVAATLVLGGFLAGELAITAVGVTAVNASGGGAEKYALVAAGENCRASGVEEGCGFNGSSAALRTESPTQGDTWFFSGVCFSVSSASGVFLGEAFAAATAVELEVGTGSLTLDVTIIWSCASSPVSFSSTFCECLLSRRPLTGTVGVLKVNRTFVRAFRMRSIPICEKVGLVRLAIAAATPATNTPQDDPSRWSGKGDSGGFIFHSETSWRA